jgi:hypothetical protein
MKDMTGRVALLKPLLASGLLLLAWACQISAAATASHEVTVPVLHVGTDYFTNATVTASSTHVTVIHSRGMTMAKMADLDPDVQRELGFDPGPVKGAKATAGSQTSTNTSLFGRLKKAGEDFQAGAEQAQTDRETKGPPLLRALRDRAEQEANGATPAERFEKATLVEKLIVLGTFAAIAVLYFLFCNACRQLCRRAGSPSEILVWLPGWKRLALYRATGTSWWWFFLVIIPVLGQLIAFIGWVLCCVRVCDAFRQSRWWAWLMISPLFGWFVFIYFAKASEADDQEPAVRSMNSGYAF